MNGASSLSCPVDRPCQRPLTPEPTHRALPVAMYGLHIHKTRPASAPPRHPRIRLKEPEGSTSERNDAAPPLDSCRLPHTCMNVMTACSGIPQSRAYISIHGGRQRPNLRFKERMGTSRTQHWGSERITAHNDQSGERKRENAMESNDIC